MRTIILAVMALVMIACGGTTHGNNALTKQEYLQTLDSAAMLKSLVFWSQDTAYSTNPELLLLLDTLYQHDFAWSAITSEADVRKEEAWVAAYRKRLCAYYDRRIAPNDTISEFAKADSVINEGLRLVKLDPDWELSTMGMVVTSNIELCFNKCKEYGQLSQLVAACEDTTKTLVYKEFACFARMSSVADTIASDVVDLHYWGGTIAGPHSMICSLSMQAERMKFYQNVIGLVLESGGCRIGVFPASAKKLYEACVSTSLANLSDFEQEYGFPEPNPELYVETKKETFERLRSILPLIDDWFQAVARLDNALTHDGSHHEIECNAAYLLSSFAEQVTWY